MEAVKAFNNEVCLNAQNICDAKVFLPLLLFSRLTLAEEEWVATARNRPLSALNKNIETVSFPESTFGSLFLLSFKLRFRNTHWSIADARLQFFTTDRC